MFLINPQLYKINKKIKIELQLVFQKVKNAFNASNQNEDNALNAFNYSFF